MSSTGMSSHSWVKFFKDAGIPSDLSARYAVMFTDHRIQKDMLNDLDRDILSDIGIKAVGDKMAIMKHARFVAEQAKRDASSKQLADGIKTLENRTSKSSSPAERMINHSISSRSPSGRNSPKNSGKESPSTQKNSPKTVTDDTEKESSKKTIFDRLGRNSPVESPAPSGVFKRLGGDMKELQYAGILKKPPSPVTVTTKKKILVTKKAKSTSILDRLGAEVPEIPDSSTEKKQKVTPPARKTVVKKVVGLNKKPVTAPVKIVSTTPKAVAIRPRVVSPPSVSPHSKRKTSILDRLGDFSVTSSTMKHQATPVAKKVPPSGDVKRKLIVLAPKKVTSQGQSLKRKSTGDIRTSSPKVMSRPVSAPKPISSNTVSSTSAFRSAAHSSSSVFDRLGKTK